MNLYTSLEEARELLRERYAQTDLRQAIEKELGEYFMPAFSGGLKSVTTRQLCTPDQGFLLFYHRSLNELKAAPLALSYYQDKFTHLNEEKKGLGRLRVYQNEKKYTVDIIHFTPNEGKQIKEVCLIDGESLVDFHKSLFSLTNVIVDTFDNSSWYKQFASAKEYYYYLLLHFVCHGVLFESFVTDFRDKESSFTQQVVVPAIEKIQEKFGVTPMIVQMYPDEQTLEEDYFWWTYPEKVNEYLQKRFLQHGYKMREVHF